MSDRLVKLVERLHDKSKTGSLAWQRAPSGAFHVSFPRYTVSISKLNFPSHALTVLNIIDQQGNIVETLGEDDLEWIGQDVEKIAQKLRETYELASELARLHDQGADKAVEAILEALESG